MRYKFWKKTLLFFTAPNGIEYLSHALRQPSCAITKLDLHLNRLTDQAGNSLFGALNQKTMKSLLLSGCGFRDALAVGRLLQSNCSLEFLDISNNNLGEVWVVHLLILYVYGQNDCDYK